MGIEIDKEESILNSEIFIKPAHLVHIGGGSKQSNTHYIWCLPACVELACAKCVPGLSSGGRGLGTRLVWRLVFITLVHVPTLIVLVWIFVILMGLTLQLLLSHPRVCTCGIYTTGVWYVDTRGWHRATTPSTLATVAPMIALSSVEVKVWDGERYRGGWALACMEKVVQLHVPLPCTVPCKKNSFLLFQTTMCMCGTIHEKTRWLFWRATLEQ